MNDHTVATIIEVVLVAAPFIGVPLLCWWDPAHLVEKKRQEEANQHG